MYLNRLFLPAVGLGALLGACYDRMDAPEFDQSPPPGAVNLCEEARGGVDEVLASSVGATPRAISVAEQLGILKDLRLSAREGRYQRIAAELSGMESRFDNLPAEEHSTCSYRYDNWSVRLTESAWIAHQAGLYDEWDALNEHLRADIADEFAEARAVTLRADGRYHVPTVVNAYEALDGVESATWIVEGVGIEIPPPSPQICLAGRGEYHYYVVYQPAQECSGLRCLHRGYTGMRFDADGNFESVGHWNGEGLIPRWLGRLGDCGMRFGIYD
jgi:hypothetical protein